MPPELHAKASTTMRDDIRDIRQKPAPTTVFQILYGSSDVDAAVGN